MQTQLYYILAQAYKSDAIVREKAIRNSVFACEPIENNLQVELRKHTFKHLS